jgi:solute carrier family 13 (sodium-dependent dicarboxylate transporter), member 2/3/5
MRLPSCHWLARCLDLPPAGFRQRLGLVLGPALFLGFGALLRSKGVESMPAWTAATVVWMAVWWITEALPLWATACLPMVLYPLLGVAPWHEVALHYLDPINFLFMGGMFIAASMQQWGLHRRVALGIVDHLGASPRRIVAGFMLATGFITLWISNTAAAMMMYPIGLAVIRKFEEQHGTSDPLLRRFGLALMLGIAYAASIGGIGTKIGTGTNLVFVKQASILLQREIDFLTWLKLALPLVLLVLPLVWLYLVRVAAPLPAQPFPGGEATIRAARAALPKMNTGEWVAAIAFLGAALSWIFRRDIDLGAVTIPGWWNRVPWSWETLLGRPISSLSPPWPDLLRDVGDACVAVVFGGLLLIIPVRRGPRPFALGVREARGIAWGLLVLLGGGFAMAYGIQRSGLSALLGAAVGQLGPMPPLVAMLGICYLTVVLTEVASNTATASILLPLIAGSAASLGLDPLPPMFAAALTASFGFMFPAGTPANAVVYSSGHRPLRRHGDCPGLPHVGPLSARPALAASELLKWAGTRMTPHHHSWDACPQNSDRPDLLGR